MCHLTKCCGAGGALHLPTTLRQEGSSPDSNPYAAPFKCIMHSEWPVCLFTVALSGYILTLHISRTPQPPLHAISKHLIIHQCYFFISSQLFCEFGQELEEQLLFPHVIQKTQLSHLGCRQYLLPSMHVISKTYRGVRQINTTTWSHSKGFVVGELWEGCAVPHLTCGNKCVSHLWFMSKHT